MNRVVRIGGQLPYLVIPWPQCGHCGEDVLIEDGVAWCEGCLISWDRIEDGETAIPDPNRDGTSVPCQIVVGDTGEPHDDKHGYHYEPGPPLPCILPSGHEGEHVCPYDVAVTPPSEAGA